VRLLGYLIITASLVLGALGAATAYNVATDLPDDRLVGLELSAPAAYRPTPGAPPVQVGGAGDAITSDMLERLRAHDVSHVRVSEFSFVRWGRGWWVLIACIGLVAGAVLVRRGTKARLAAATAAAEHASFARAIERIEAGLAELRAGIQSMDPREATREIVRRVGDIQGEHVAAFVDAREELIGRLGLGRFAELMDRFASLERALNRAWSAAADGHLGESTAALERADALLPDVKERIPEG